MSEQSRARTRGMAIATFVLVITLAAPALAAPAGAATARSATRTELHSRGAVHAQLLAKHRPRKVKRIRLQRMKPARRRALLIRYIKNHPGVVAAHQRTPAVTLATKVRRARYLATHPRARKKVKPAAHRKAHKPAPKKKAKKTKKKKAASGSGLHHDAMLLGGLALGAMALFLILSSVRNQPRARARARARRKTAPLATR